MSEERFIGFVELGNTIDAAMQIKNSSGSPADPTAAPTYRIYGPNGLMAGGTGSLSYKDTNNNISGATNASPVVITSNGHGLTTGTTVTISGILGNTNANGTWVITAINSNTFSLNGSSGNASYTSGGQWHVTGLYDFNYEPTGSNGFESGECYSVLVQYVVSSTSYADVYTFIVS